jgi:hypothetical protein
VPLLSAVARAPFQQAARLRIRSLVIVKDHARASSCPTAATVHPSKKSAASRSLFFERMSEGTQSRSWRSCQLRNVVNFCLFVCLGGTTKRTRRNRRSSERRRPLFSRCELAAARHQISGVWALRVRLCKPLGKGGRWEGSHNGGARRCAGALLWGGQPQDRGPFPCLCGKHGSGGFGVGIARGPTTRGVAAPKLEVRLHERCISSCCA